MTIILPKTFQLSLNHNEILPNDKSILVWWNTFHEVMIKYLEKNLKPKIILQRGENFEFKM